MLLAQENAEGQHATERRLLIRDCHHAGAHVYPQSYSAHVPGIARFEDG